MEAEVVAATTLGVRPKATALPDAAVVIANFRYDIDQGYGTVQSVPALQIQRQRTSLSPIVFISADSDLSAAASAEGLTVDSPNAHS